MKEYDSFSSKVVNDYAISSLTRPFNQVKSPTDVLTREEIFNSIEESDHGTKLEPAQSFKLRALQSAEENPTPNL